MRQAAAHQEDRVRRAGCRPDGVEPEKIFVDERLDWTVVPERRHTANSEAGRGPNEVSVRLRYVGLQVQRDEPFIDPVRPARDDEDWQT